MSHDADSRIRERAYHLWEAAGRPHGRDREFWHEASQHERSRHEDGPTLAVSPDAEETAPAPTKGRRIKAAEPAEAAKPKRGSRKK